jgi:hypothetical protein
MYRPQISVWESRESLRRQRAELVTVRDLIYHGDPHQIFRLIDQVRAAEDEDSHDGVRFECKLLNMLLRRKIATLEEVEQQLEDPLLTARSDYMYFLSEDGNEQLKGSESNRPIPQTDGSVQATVADAERVRPSTSDFCAIGLAAELENWWPSDVFWAHLCYGS